jgi:3-dehydroquinate dehydratase-2
VNKRATEPALRIGVLHGPNLNRLGEREPELYGRASLPEIDLMVSEAAADLGADTLSFQSNLEGELVDWIQGTTSSVEGWVVNAGAYTHTSVALRDALTGSGLPFVEIHLTNVHAREPFRRRSLLADVAIGVISGFGSSSYLLGLHALVEHLRPSR